MPAPQPPPSDPAATGPRPTLSLVDGLALVVGIVLGAGIFRTPSVVAANMGSETGMLLAWLLGGCISLIGAMCYAELAATYPHAGGDYHYLHRAFGRDLAFMFAWARLSVIPTGSIALLAYVFGDYATTLADLGPYSSTLWGIGAVLALTTLNVLGLRHGTRTQNLLMALTVIGLSAVIVAGLSLAAPAPAGDAPAAGPLEGQWGLVMIFVLLTYGGWNEAAYLSAEMRGGRRGIVRVLLISLGLITALYLLANWAYPHGLGMEAMASSEAVAADLMRVAIGERGAQLISVLIGIAALTSINATIVFGARSSWALGRDFPLFSWLGRWHDRAGNPINAVVVQGGIALLLILLGAVTRQGFETMVEYTAPIFWLFFLLTGIGLFVLRARDPAIERPFRVPLYPLTPLLFCASSAYLLYASLAHTGIGALAGVVVLVLGLPFLWLDRRHPRQPTGGSR